MRKLYVHNPSTVRILGTSESTRAAKVVLEYASELQRVGILGFLELLRFTSAPLSVVKNVCASFT